MTTPPPSYVRQNYHVECEAFVNTHISLELYASYVYLAMASHFNSAEVALKRFGRFFLRRSSKKRAQADRLIELQSQRGGRLRLRDISRPEQDGWQDGLTAMEDALHMETRVHQSLLELHQLASEKRDAHLCDFLERHFLQEQVQSIQELGGHVTKLRKMGAPESGLAEVLFDELILGDSDTKN